MMSDDDDEVITKTCLHNFDPFKPHLYIIKLGFTGVYIIVLFSDPKHRLWVLVRTASQRRFKRVSTIYILSRNMKNIRVFLSENFQFLEVKFSIYLNRHVFVMRRRRSSGLTTHQSITVVCIKMVGIETAKICHIIKSETA